MNINQRWCSFLFLRSVMKICDCDKVGDKETSEFNHRSVQKAIIRKTIKNQTAVGIVIAVPFRMRGYEWRIDVRV